MDLSLGRSREAKVDARVGRATFNRDRQLIRIVLI
jgi:hypothetical protein